MDFIEGVQRAMRAYWRGDQPENLRKEMPGRMKYTKEYFDKFEEKNFGSTEDMEEEF